MNEAFLSKLLRVARQVTMAERGMAVNTELAVLERVNIDQTTLQDRAFMNFANLWLQRAIDEEQTIITNNIITDVSQAPTTNTNFSNLRVAVVIPVRGVGAVYLDQHIRHGVIPRDIIDRLTQMVNQVQDSGNEEISEEQMLEQYERLN